MSIPRTAALLSLSLLASLFLSTRPLVAQQTDNHRLHAVPPPGSVTIDGALDDWDLSGQLAVYANYRMRHSYSTQVAAMYDENNFYLAIVWRDPSPMHNMIDARFDIGSGWRSDCLQLRLKTDMVVGAVDCWYSTAAERPVININYGNYRYEKDQEHTENFQPLPDALQAGAQQAFQRGQDGKSYVQEIALPWKLITAQSAIRRETGQPYKEPRQYHAGDEFQMGMEFLWGGPDGKTWPVHRYADLLAEGQTSREFFWTNDRIWGTVILSPHGNLKLTQPASAELDAGEYLQQTTGPVPLTYEMPFAGFATLVIEDDQGDRVRNLIGMAPRSQGRQTEYWDGIDEQGNLAPPGRYRYRGLVHQGIDPVYEASYGTPGDPPWPNAKGTGQWLSDHHPPIDVAAGKEMLALASAGSEAGYALIGIDLEGNKQWSQRKFQGISAIAVDGDYVYLGMDSIHFPWLKTPKTLSIGRCRLDTGAYAPFHRNGEKTLIVAIEEDATDVRLTGIAVNQGQVAVALRGPDVVRFYSDEALLPLRQVPLADPGPLVGENNGSFLAISGRQVVRIADGKITPVITGGLAKPTGLAVDAEGRIYVSDEATHQVKVFRADGSYSHAIGRAGGRQQPGTWQADGLRHPHGITLDSQGRLWVAEEDMWPKRYSVWSTDGAFLHDFIGPATYGGMGAVVDADDKTRVFGNGCEYRLDYDQNQATVVANVITGNLVGDLVKRDGREYLMLKKSELFQRRDDALLPVAKWGTIEVDKLADSGLPLNPKQDVVRYRQSSGAEVDQIHYVWSDRNDDGAMQAEEFTTDFQYRLGSGYWGGYWLDDDFNLVSAPGGYNRQEITVLPLQGFTAGGAPLWDTAAQRLVNDWTRPGAKKLFWATGGQILVGVPLTAMTYDGEVRWTYKDDYADVHGSHHAPIPQRDDQLIGTISCIGMADSNVGRVFACNSNMGRLYLMTTDGLFVAAVFQDTRNGPQGWPEQAVRGTPLGGISMGGEWFGGYFFSSKPTDEYYLVAGSTSYNLIRLDGFDALQALPTQTFTFSDTQLATAEKLQQQRAAETQTRPSLTIRTLTEPPLIDGRLAELPEEAFVQWAAGPYRARASLAVSDGNLYLAYQVNGDTNPLVNGGEDVTQLFISGDAVDLQLGADPEADPQRNAPVAGDLRLLISVLNDQPVAVLYRWKTEGEKKPQTFRSPWREVTLDSVEVLGTAQIEVVRGVQDYRLEALVPLVALGFKPQTGHSYPLDLGVIFSDATGRDRAARVYWSNPATGLVNDVPGEIMAHPNLWGAAKME